MRPAVFAFLGFSVAAPCLCQEQPPCATRTDLVGSCRAVHGRLYVTNGIPLRIWVVGTTRRLVVKQDVSATGQKFYFLIPRSLLLAVDFNTRLYGDFTVCPLSKEQEGVMQDVCVESGTNLVQERLLDDGRKTVKRLPDAVAPR